LPVDRLAAAARAVHPHGKLTYVYLYGSGTASTMVRFSDADQVYVDTCSGEVLGHQARYGGLYGTVEALHRFRFMNAAAGLSIIGTAALLFALVMICGGLYLWWPRRTSAWRSALRFNPRLRGRAFALNLHTTIGAYAGVVVFVVALTAVPLSLGWAKAAMFAVTGTTDMTEDAKLPIAARKSIEPKSGAVISMQAAWEKARGVIGGPLLWASLHYPRKGEPIEIGIVETGAPHADARSYVFIDSRTAQIVELRPWATLNAGSKLYYWLLALHTGHFGGVFVQCLMLAGMIGVAALGYTGVETFLRRTFRRPKISNARRLSRLER
jgi:vanillate O-demethylase ferredoxin subunit